MTNARVAGWAATAGAEPAVPTSVPDPRRLRCADSTGGPTEATERPPRASDEPKDGARLRGTNLRLGHAEHISDSRLCRQAVQLLRQFAANSGGLQTPFLPASRNVHTPHPVPEVPLQLTSQRRNLQQIVEAFASMLVTLGEPPRQGQIPPTNRLPQPHAVPRRTPATPQRPGGLHCGPFAFIESGRLRRSARGPLGGRSGHRRAGRQCEHGNSLEVSRSGYRTTRTSNGTRLLAP